MISFRSVISAMVPILGGALAGTIATVIVSREAVDEKSRKSTAVASESRKLYVPQSISSVNPEIGATDLKDLKQRLSALEQRDEQQDSGQKGSEERAEMPDPEEWKARKEDHHREVIAAHERATEDPEWAPQTRASLLNEIRTVGSGSFDVRDVDCRTTTCAAVLEWNNYEEALGSWSTAVEHNYDVNCAREILLPEPSDRSAPYQATMVVTCPRDSG
ncbi:hypothetical protein WME99_47805 [Sorangium sp. So ce136]|uniref:hypothetical protein n=1 Tax=Sorangium sp. So ce136 TaxID=3133284 RepID=UPI003F0CEEC4